MDRHAHRWTLRTGPQVVSSAEPDVPYHRHEVRGGLSGPPISVSGGHTHKLAKDGIEIESGPVIPKEVAKKDMDDYGTGQGRSNAEALSSARSLNKAILPDLVDPDHTYIFKTGELGLFDYWYIDNANNYWKYTNAPEDHEDYDPNLGIPVMDRNQPTPAENPQFFTFEGSKRHMAVPEDLLADRNENYSAVDPKNVWFEVYERDGDRRYIYLDADVRENIDLWVQYQLRITDANIPNMRKFAVEKFNKPHVKDKIIAAIIMLMDQGLYELEDLVNASVADLEFIESTVKLLGRKFVTDPDFLDFLTSLKAGRDDSAPLFMVPSISGEAPLGIRHIASIFKYLKVMPTYLLVWSASYLYSKAVNRLSFELADPDEVDAMALSEVKRSFGTQKDLQHLIDTKLRTSLLENYKAALSKSMIPRVESDEYATLFVISDLIGRRDDEIEFSTWLHVTPFHELTPEEEAQVEESMDTALAQAEEEQPIDGDQSEEESPVADQEEGAVDTENASKEPV